MQISKFTISSARKVPHPALDFANQSVFISIEAQLGPDDEFAACIRRTQDMADYHVEQHLSRIAAQSDRPLLTPVISIADKTANTAQRLAEKHGSK